MIEHAFADIDSWGVGLSAWLTRATGDAPEPYDRSRHPNVQLFDEAPVARPARRHGAKPGRQPKRRAF